MLVVSGATVATLEEIDSPSPANFGGDGHIYYGLYYLDITADPIDFTGTTGVNRHCLFMRAGRDHVAPPDVNFVSDLEYSGSHFGHAFEISIVDQTSRLNDLVGMFINDVVRTIDDINIDKTFFYVPDPAAFDDSWSFHNAEPVPFSPSGGAQSSIDWMQNAPAGDGNFSIGQLVDAVATDFPGACRVLSYAASWRIRAHCEVTPVEP